MSDLNQQLIAWAAKAGEEAFPQLQRGHYLAHAPRGAVLRFGRVEGFSVELRPRTPGAAPILHPSGLRIDPVVQIRIAMRTRGRLAWAPACTLVMALTLPEWRLATADQVRDLLSEIDRHIEPRATGISIRAAIDLSPDKGR